MKKPSKQQIVAQEAADILKRYGSRLAGSTAKYDREKFEDWLKKRVLGSLDAANDALAEARTGGLTPAERTEALRDALRHFLAASVGAECKKPLPDDESDGRCLTFQENVASLERGS